MRYQCVYSYVRERYLKKISVVGVYRAVMHTEREVQLRMFASYRSLELQFAI